MGNRYAPESIKEQLTEVIEQHITDYGVTTFIVGKYGSFDQHAKGVLREAKLHHPEIELLLLAPYALIQPVDTPEGFDGTLFPEGLETVPKPLLIVQANKFMVERSEYLIAYCRNPAGNTQKIVDYAKRREKKGLIKVTLLNS